MRHLRSIVYALVLAPAVWILCGVGFDQDLTGRARDNGGIESLSGVLLLLLAGAAYAILLLAPVSPAGPLLAGLVLAGVGAWARIAPDSYAGVWPANVTGDGFDVSTPGYGLAVLLAVPLLCVALSARRWRGFEPPEILLIGTIGRARGAAQVAGTPMASERTTVIPQQRQAPEFGAPSADATQIVPPVRPAGGPPADDGDERTTVLRLGRPPEPDPGQRTDGDEPTEIASPAAAAEQATGDVAGTGDSTGSEDPTRDVTAAETTRDVAAPGDETTRDVAASRDETTRDVMASGEETTRLVPAAAESADRGEKTQLLTLPKAHDAAPDRDDRTEAVRTGTVEPPGDRTQLLTLPAPGEPATVPEDTRALSIAGAERPDPGEDPTTRLTPPARSSGRPPGEETTRANPAARPMTVTGVERPADEAADDTRPLTLPAPRPAAEEDTTRRL